MEMNYIKWDWAYTNEKDLIEYLDNKTNYQGYTILSVQRTRRMFIPCYLVVSHKLIDFRTNS